MKVCVYGAGAIGCHVAARLVSGGADVSVVARGSQLAAIREQGLRVETPDGTLTAHPRASDDPADLGPQDAVLVTVKAPALTAVAAAIAPLLRPDTPVVFVMNGIPWWYCHGLKGDLAGRQFAEIDPDGIVWRHIGPERAVGGVVYSSCTVTAPGTVRVLSAKSRIILGEPTGEGSSRAAALAAILRAGGFVCEVTDQIRDAIWTKLAWNIATGPICALARAPMNVALADPTVEAAVRALLAEGIAIARGLGCMIAPDIDAIVKAVRSSPHKPSILQDLELGRPMEIDALYTIPLALAEMASVPAPTLGLLTALLRLQAQQGRQQ
ncbi:2-dehydropantoate 2-reductase [Acidisoma cellulosilytica]|uniref:2-dehydropantoate 2-reductase n=1 Tax=Acidisoma cellulosilyticum TaxID=2802395 RepID=A0A963Z4H1_9PROT|nr:2-dehydropantoate 2-reductase [Acidisoma cellulosilyticum]MCB8882366.1 2-dehydropantoate 2-reductase [Acidisoma cellulosilyticum]